MFAEQKRTVRERLVWQSVRRESNVDNWMSSCLLCDHRHICHRWSFCCFFVRRCQATEGPYLSLPKSLSLYSWIISFVFLAIHIWITITPGNEELHCCCLQLLCQLQLSPQHVAHCQQNCVFTVPAKAGIFSRIAHTNLVSPVVIFVTVCTSVVEVRCMGNDYPTAEYRDWCCGFWK